jgi:hypothetical protein
MKKINVRVGDNINVDVCQPKFGKYPIGRFNGMVCKLILPETIKRLEYGCTVDATVMVTYEKYLTVLVNEVIVSAAANHVATENKLNELKSMFTKPIKHEKVKRSYPCLSKVELNQQSNL